MIYSVVNRCNKNQRPFESMLELQRRQQSARAPQEKDMLARQIESTDGQIDRLVYQLYGLSEEEIKIVEEKR